MRKFKKHCCNHLEEHNPCPPILKDPQFKPQGCLQPGKDPSDLSSLSCFNPNSLPNIETTQELMYELCNVQQAFDKCPLYYTKQNYEDLINTMTKAFFHLYVKMNTIAGTPWFEGYAYNGTDPIEVAEKDGRDFPGVYVASEFGEFKYFLDVQGNSIVISEDDFNENIIFFKPVIVAGTNTFTGYELVMVNKGGSSNVNVISTLQQSITYSELVDLVDQGKLNPGQLYRITDYEFTTIQKGTESAGHKFDIIVTALDIDVLDENAKAIWHNWTGQEYFDNNPLYLWDLKYSIYNDTSLYAWADQTNGKGVIYWLKDEFGNEAGYDFKNALFTKGLIPPQTPNSGLISDDCDKYITFCGTDLTTDGSLTENYKNCKIAFSKTLPYNKFLVSCIDININGSFCYIDNSTNVDIIGTLNYINVSNNIKGSVSNTIVTESSDISFSGGEKNEVIECDRIEFNNSTLNILNKCKSMKIGNGSSYIIVTNWNHCNIGENVSNISSIDADLWYSNIGYNNIGIVFKGDSNTIYKYKIINPNTFQSIPSVEFEFDKTKSEELELITKQQFITFIG